MTQPAGTVIIPAKPGSKHNISLSRSSPHKVNSIKIGTFRFEELDAAVLNNFANVAMSRATSESIPFLGTLLMGLVNFEPNFMNDFLKKHPILARNLDNGVRLTSSTREPTTLPKRPNSSPLARILGEMCMSLGSTDGVRWLFECGGDAAGVLEDTKTALKKKISDKTSRTFATAIAKGDIALWRLFHEAHGNDIFWKAGITGLKGRPRVYDLVEAKRADVLALALSLDPTLLDAKWKPGDTLLGSAQKIKANEVVDVLLSATARQAAQQAVKEGMNHGMGPLKEVFGSQAQSNVGTLENMGPTGEGAVNQRKTGAQRRPQ